MYVNVVSEPTLFFTAYQRCGTKSVCFFPRGTAVFIILNLLLIQFSILFINGKLHQIMCKENSHHIINATLALSSLC